MIPIVLSNPSLPVAVIGWGMLALRRFQALERNGLWPFLFLIQPTQADDAAMKSMTQHDILTNTDPTHILQRPPSDAEWATMRAAWIVGLDHAPSAALAEHAQRHKVLVNVEDVPEYCDFHNVAEIRRGDLLLTVSTGGQGPGLASHLRKHLETQFGPEWAERVKEIAVLRKQWRASGHSMPDVATLIGEHLCTKGWLSSP
jgi:precorrin-2 dehydrogenase/sirohydrochlorin ferrochelatase